MFGDSTGSIIYTARLKKIIYKQAKGIELEDSEKRIVEKIIATKDKP